MTKEEQDRELEKRRAALSQLCEIILREGVVMTHFDDPEANAVIAIYEEADCGPVCLRHPEMGDFILVHKDDLTLPVWSSQSNDDLWNIVLDATEL